ncbi:MAG: hypothetical protein Q8S53_02085 [Brevundimonas sp.]|uniref:hypothetical protein n=1 Tax=Brevundimonas sp. TaxID=1871086 RepID=UPI0027351BE9|nr:hypothetical protein [Brevundimonas sp.]MDP3377126.1 hypothetical protein [Brevundimonas sp.]
MRRGLCLALTLIAAATATPAAAQSFETFKRFCLETGGAPDSVLAALGAAGWEADPRNANLPAGSSVTLMSDPKAGTPSTEMAMIGFIPTPGGLSVPVCSVMGPAVEAELVEGVTAWAGFAPVVSPQGWSTWVYSVGPDRLIPQSDLVDASDAKLQAAASARGTIHNIQVRTARAGPFLIHSRVGPDTPISPAD